MRTGTRVRSSVLGLAAWLLLAAASPAANAASSHTPPQALSRGYLTTPAELEQIAAKAAQGIEPYRSAVTQLLEYSAKPWKWNLPPGHVGCPSADEPAYLARGSILIYAKALAFRLTDNSSYAAEVIPAIAGLLNVESWGDPAGTTKVERHCQLNLSWTIPGFIRAADLLESYPPWEKSGLKRRFQQWLATVVYPVVSFTAEVSVSNWGAAACNLSTYIADYLWDRQDLRLVTTVAGHSDSRTPAQAYQHAVELTLARMNGTRAERPGGSSRSCDLNPRTKSMIRPDGGIPDELRRGSSGCEAAKIISNDSSNMYSQTHLQNLIAQAELLWRRGDRRLYDNVQKQAQPWEYVDAKGRRHTVVLPAGRGSLRQAILFVIDHPSFQTPRALRSAAEVAARYYHDPVMFRMVQPTRPNSGTRAMAFETLTHGFAQDETPAPPPVVAPPRD
jgi:hypothetical protein